MQRRFSSPLQFEDTATFAYRKGAEKYRAAFVRKQAKSLLTRGKQVLGVQLARERLYAQETILASGAWTPQADEWLDITIPIRPQRGQLVIVGQLMPELHHIIFNDDIYLAPKGDQTITIGAANDSPGYVQTPTVNGLTDLLSQGQAAIPTLGDANFITIRAGL